jgi:hypothetical protein
MSTTPVADPSLWPGFLNQPICVRDRFTGTDHPDDIRTMYGCADWTCLCNHYAIAVPTLAAFVSNCQRNAFSLTITEDVVAATSIFSAFCVQLPGVVTQPTGATVTITAPTSFVRTVQIMSTATIFTQVPPGDSLRSRCLC